MYDVNSGGVQPCDTFLSTPKRGPPISISAARMSCQAVRTHVPRSSGPVARPRPRSGSGARDPATRAEDPGPSTAAPVRPARVRPRRSRRPGKSPVDIRPSAVRLVVILSRD